MIRPSNKFLSMAKKTGNVATIYYLSTAENSIFEWIFFRIIDEKWSSGNLTERVIQLHMHAHSRMRGGVKGESAPQEGSPTRFSRKVHFSALKGHL